MLTPEQKLEGNKGLSHMHAGGKAFQADTTATAKALN